MSVVTTCRNRASAQGFSLLELFIAVAVLSILTILALPSVQELSRRMTLTEHNNDLVGALTTAKADAAKLGVIAGVVGTTNDWSAGGWNVQVDSDHNNTLTSADTVISTYAALTNQYTVKTKVTGGNDAQIIFNAQGTLATPATAADVNVCRPDNKPTQSLWIHVAPSGEITSRRDTSSSPAPAC